MLTQLPVARDLGRVSRWFLPVSASADPRNEPDVPTPRQGDTNDDYEPEFYVTIAKFIGFSSSQTPRHWDHPIGQFVGKDENGRRQRCNACRWFELRIFRELDGMPDDLTNLDLDREFDLAVADANGEDDEPTDARLGSYVVCKIGMSIVPGEVPFCRYDVIRSPYQVVEALTTRKVTDRGSEQFMTKPSAYALAAAANFDPELEHAYLNRAIA